MPTPHSRATSTSSHSHSHHPFKPSSSSSSHPHPLSGGINVGGGAGAGAGGGTIGGGTHNGPHPAGTTHTPTKPDPTSGPGGRRPRSRSSTALSSPRLTRLRLRIHTIISQPPFLPLRRLTTRRPFLTSLILLTCLFIYLLTSSSSLLDSGLQLPTHPLDPQASAAFSLTKPRLDQGGNQIPDSSETQQQVEIQRSFEEPDFGLLSSKQPHEIGCEVWVDWVGEGKEVGLFPPGSKGTWGSGLSPSLTSSSSSTQPPPPPPPPPPLPLPPSNQTYPLSTTHPAGVLIFLGIFSAAQSADKSPLDMQRRRHLYRTHYIPQFPSHLVTVKFILGLPPLAGVVRNPAAAIGRAKVMRMIEEEKEEFGDMVILDMEDNIDSGKTHKYFQWVAKEYGGPGQVKGRPRFVMKSDDDTLVVMPNLISAFKDLDCSTNVYMGTSAGRSQYFGDYFRGLAYAMSWPLISWIGEADMPMAHITKIEDARTGQWLRHLDPVQDPIHRIDYGWTMGDWNQLDVGLETVALHWCKWDDWVIEQQNKIQSIWKFHNRPFRWDRGIDPSISIAKGKITPEEAEREHQRQIEQGWDVEGNLKGDTGDG